MIILDSNILKGISLRGPEAELLRAIRTSGVERVAAPWIVMEELAAQQALAYERKHAEAHRTVTALDKATPWGNVTPPAKAEPEVVRDHWRTRYSELAGTLKTSPAAYEQAMFREANLLAPCKTVNSGKNKTGARDAAIWLTAVEYAREHPEETVYFISNNPEDFGDGTAFKYPLDEDLKGLEERFVLFTSLDDVVAKFATEVEAPEQDVQEALAKPEAGFAIVQAARHDGGLGFIATQVDRKSRQLLEVPVHGWFGPPSVALSSVSDVRAYEIAGHKWCTATTRWLLAGRVPQSHSHAVPIVNWAWEARVLLSPTAPEKGLTVLRGSAFTPITSEDIDRLPPDLFFGVSEELLHEVASLNPQFQNTPELLKRLTRALDGYRPPDLSPYEQVLRNVQALETWTPLRQLQDSLDYLHAKNGLSEDEPDQENG